MAGVDSDAITMIKVGPGGWPNSNDVEWELKGVSRITQIFISFGEDRHSSYIHSLQFQYIKDGLTKLSSVFGSHSNHAGFQFQTVVFSEVKLIWDGSGSGEWLQHGENEYITGVSGAALHDVYFGKKLTSLTFETNLKKYGPFGSIPARAKCFSFQFGIGNRFAGFFGHCSSSKGITTIGCYFSPNLLNSNPDLGHRFIFV